LNWFLFYLDKKRNTYPISFKIDQYKTEIPEALARSEFPAKKRCAIHSGGGRKIMDEPMEIELAKWWIEEIKAKGALVPLSVIKKRAREKSQQRPKFKASKGWLDKFIKRYKIDQQI
jgi:hypothetical protein